MITFTYGEHDNSRSRCRIQEIRFAGFQPLKGLDSHGRSAYPYPCNFLDHDQVIAKLCLHLFNTDRA